MSNFRARLHMEFSELQIKKDKLMDFIADDKFDTLTEIDRKDLLEQLKHMKGYESVLGRRVSRLCGNG